MVGEARPGWRRLLLLWLAGLDLRVTLLAVPPVLPLVHRELGLDEKGVAALASLPILLLGLGAVPGSLLISRIGARRALISGLLLIGVTSALRGVGSSLVMLFAMTLAMGAGIAIIQPAFPSLVRVWFPHAVTRATGAWSNGLLVGELVSASFTIPLVLPLVGGRWEASFVFWSVPVLLTTALVAFATSHVSSEARAWRGAGVPNWRSGRMWVMGVFQSASALVYFGANTFIPDYLHATDQADLVALALASVNTAQVPASFVIGLVPWRILGRKTTSLLVGAGIFASLAAVLSQNPVLIVVGAGAFGFCAAYILVLSFALPALLARPEDVSRVSAGMFTISYVTSFLATLAAGAAWDATHIKAMAFLPVVLGGLIALLLGPRLVEASAASAAVAAQRHGRA